MEMHELVEGSFEKVWVRHFWWLELEYKKNTGEDSQKRRSVQSCRFD